MKRQRQRGFTLIELLVVIAIIGILATIVLVSLSSAREKARDSRRLSDLRQVVLALEMYYSDYSIYPGTAATGDEWAALDTALEATGYMRNVPIDPTNDSGNDYIYEYCTDTSAYVLNARLEDVNNPALRPERGDVDGNDIYGCDCDDDVAVTTGEEQYCIQP